jgi:hypothetical protein
MKRQILFFISFLLSVFSCQFVFAQKYYTLVDTNKIWSIQRTIIAHPNSYDSYYIKFSTDTIIKNKVYKQVLITYESSPKNWLKSGFIRETEDKKVYYLIYKNDEFDYILYDFNLKKGDTLGYLKVDSIDTILIENQNRKIFYFGGRETWIEGIGSTCGVLSAGRCAWHGGESSLLCYSENDSLKYQNPDFDYCYIQESVGLNQINNIQEEIKIVPNPAGEEAIVSWQSAEQSTANISVYDIVGKLVYVLDVSQAQHDKNKLKINTSKLDNGIYFIRLNTDEGSSSGKFVVAH